MQRSGDQLAALLRRPTKGAGSFLKKALALHDLADRFVDELTKENNCHDPETGQFCDTGTSKQKSSHPGGVKGHVHELLASGNSFTVAQLAQATGASEERVKFLLTRLQNPKYAAKEKNALVIQKEGNTYRVIGTKPALSAEEKKALKAAKTEQAPIGTNALGPHSFNTTPGEKGQFRQANEALGKALHDGAEDKYEQKRDISKRLGEILEDNKAFQAVANAFHKPTYGEGTPGQRLAAEIIHGWAATSADADARAKAMQLAARDEFNIKDAALGHMGIHSAADEEQIWHSAAAQFGFKPIGTSTYNQRVSDQDLATFKAGMRAFTRAEYENTQAFFKERGITEVSVFRGTKQSHSGGPTVTSLHGQPLSSFSSSLSTAHMFSSGRMYMATFPVSHVVGSFRTGRGCMSESEVVILGHPIKVVRASKSDFWSKNEIDRIGAAAFGKTENKITYGQKVKY